MMAGHNKWSKIRHKKGANDVKKALLLGKASKSLTIVSKECKGDRSDPRLQAAIQHAKSVKLPKDRIEDAIDKGIATKGGGGDDYFPLRFDAMMRFEDDGERNTANASSSVQVACIVTALSDNRNRTTQNIRHLVNKHGGEFLPTDHLNYLFEKVGHIEVESKPKNSASSDDDSDCDHGDDWSLEEFEEEMMDCALEAGATNVEPLEGDDEDEIDASIGSSRFRRFLVTTEDTDLWKVARALGASDSDDGGSYTIAECEHRYVLKEEYGAAEFVSIRSESEAHDRLGDFLDRLDEDEDVHKVYHNAVLS
jgi:transcriptional/translational regulatory protein YebC/TACO1